MQGQGKEEDDARGWQRRERRSAWMRGWFLGGGGREGRDDGERRATTTTTTTTTMSRTERRQRVAEVFEARDHCAADITASSKITNILERRSSPVIKDGAYGDIRWRVRWQRRASPSRR